MKIIKSGIHVHGIGMDRETRCTHYHQHHDIIAIQCYCCRSYYCCYECHLELCGSAQQKWPQSEFDHAAVLCGRCGTALSIRMYLESGYQCPFCSAAFNPACRRHYSLYFQ
ncbi:CHY zinc finger protein [Salibacterium sp. K-3]